MPGRRPRMSGAGSSRVLRASGWRFAGPLFWQIASGVLALAVVALIVAFSRL